MGSAACYHLAKSGVRVLGIDQFQVPHERGSHTGQSRLIRKAYFEHPNYVPLLKRAYELWEELEDESKTQLFHKTGIAYFGRRGSPILTGAKESAAKHDLRIDEIDKSSVQFESLKIPQKFNGLFEKEAGYVLPELTIKSQVELAQKNGAHLLENTEIKSWKKSAGQIKVETDKGIFTTDRLILTAGTYTNSLIQTIPDLKVRVTRQILGWVYPTIGMDSSKRLPCWVIAHPEDEGIIYGFPFNEAEGPKGLKIAYHFPGEEINPKSISEFDTKNEVDVIHKLARQYLNIDFDVSKTVVKNCMYGYSKDENFIIDFTPESENKVIIATGFSGHGFKFSPVVGEILKDLAMNGKSSLPIDFLAIR